MLGSRVWPTLPSAHNGVRGQQVQALAVKEQGFVATTAAEQLPAARHQLVISTMLPCDQKRSYLRRRFLGHRSQFCSMTQQPLPALPQ